MKRPVVNKYDMSLNLRLFCDRFVKHNIMLNIPNIKDTYKLHINSKQSQIYVQTNVHNF